MRLCMLLKAFAFEVTPCLQASRSRARHPAPIMWTSEQGRKNWTQGLLFGSQACNPAPRFHLYHWGKVRLLPGHNADSGPRPAGESQSPQGLVPGGQRQLAVTFSCPPKACHG